MSEGEDHANLELPTVPFWTILSDEDWKLVTETVCDIWIGGSYTAMQAVLEHLRNKLKVGWRLVPPDGEGKRG